MSRILRLLGLGLVVVVLLLGGAYAWAQAASARTLSRTIPSHTVDFPIPFPLSAEEVSELGLAPEEAARVALQRATERGQHLLAARYPCADCHGANYGGGVMVDAFPIGSFLGPNLTAGTGSRVSDYTAADWDRAVRHGILPDGRPSVMPSQDFARMSDQELSDIVVYLRSLPAVDNVVPASRPGPLARVLLAAKKMPLSADLIGEHEGIHLGAPPAAAVDLEFGRHLAGVCAGCHGASFSGGPVPGGDPAWVPAANLTPHADGLAGWELADFRKAMREGIRPDGSTVAIPMSGILPYAQQMTDVELEALWMYLSSLEPRPTGG